jgi:hypothetical protein
MNSKNCISILTVIFIGSFSLSIVYLQEQNFGLPAGFASSSSSSSLSNPTNIVTEGNSTFSNSTQGENQVVSKVIVIPNPNAALDSNLDESTLSNANNNESDLSTTSNKTKTPSLQNNNDSGLESQDSTNPQQNNNNNNTNTSSSQNPMQRGEYKVDDNGVHYYNINNCSLVKGSSGIGDLSECEDAEREIQQELNG